MKIQKSVEKGKFRRLRKRNGEGDFMTAFTIGKDTILLSVLMKANISSLCHQIYRHVKSACISHVLCGEPSKLDFDRKTFS